MYFLKKKLNSKHLSTTCPILSFRRVLPVTVSFGCHLDERRGLFVRRDFSSLARRNDSFDVAFCHSHIVPSKNWVATQGDSQTKRSPRLNARMDEQFGQG